MRRRCGLPPRRVTVGEGLRHGDGGCGGAIARDRPFAERRHQIGPLSLDAPISDLRADGFEPPGRVDSGPLLRRGRAALLRRLCSLMGQGRRLGDERYRRCRVSAFSACSLWHLMGSAGCRVARLKSQSASLAACYRIGAVICSLPRASLRSGARFDLLSG
jgi:hypothetical protein